VFLARQGISGGDTPELQRWRNPEFAEPKLTSLEMRRPRKSFSELHAAGDPKSSS